jgi:uncharacterized protein (DUF1697 family)
LAGFSNELVYGSSGNVVFSASLADRDELVRVIERSLGTSFGRHFAAFALSPDELREVEANKPFVPSKQGGEQACHVMFLTDEPDEVQRDALLATQHDYRFAVRGGALCYTFGRDLKAHRRTVDFEKLRGVRATSRTCRVIARLVERTS